MDAGMSLGGTDTSNLEEMHRAALEDEARIVLVAEVQGEVVAMAHIAPSGADNAPHRAEVQRVAVAETARGGGVGRSLMTAVEAIAAKRGLTLLWLTTHDETDACSFYEAVGYAKLGVMPAYSQRPDGTLAPGAFYYKVLTGSS